MSERLFPAHVYEFGRLMLCADQLSSNPDVREVQAANRVQRRSDGGPLLDGDSVLDQVRPRCPWCDEVLDDEGRCARRCAASRVNRTDDR